MSPAATRAKPTSSDATSDPAARKVAPQLTDAQRRMVEDHLRLVDQVVRPYRARCRSSLQHEDLYQIGAIALTEVALRYDPSRGTAFGALALKRVRGAIADHFRSLDPLTRGERADLRALERVRAEATQELGRVAEPAEILERLGWSEDRLALLQSAEQSLACGWAQTRQAPHEDALDAAFGGPQPDPGPESALEAAEIRDLVVDTLDDLPQRQRLVLSLYYREELKLAEIGEVLGVSESRICQLHRESLALLRRRMQRSLEAPRVG